jgi:hypothetical protein
MVYFIKNANELASIRLICKAMINMEQNKCIYDINGELNDAETAKTPFNSYNYKRVNFNININIGMVLFYTNSNITISAVLQTMINIFNELNINKSDDTPINHVVSGLKNGTSIKSTHHTLVKRSADISTMPPTTDSVINVRGYRKLIMNANDFKKVHMFGSQYIWCVNIVSCNYINIPELSEKFLSDEYLSRAVSTIVYDNKNLFNVDHGTKQLNYPSLDQYTQASMVIKNPIKLCYRFGLDCQIISYYTDMDLKYIPYPDHLAYHLIDSPKAFRVDLKKSWLNQIRETFNYELQEELESKCSESGKPPFPMDLCFITRMPLYNYAYMLDIFSVHYGKPKTILVSPILCHCLIDGVDFGGYLKNTTTYTINKYTIVKCKRTELDAIKEIPADKITEDSRALLHAISKYGCHYDDRTNIIYSLDLDTRQIYIGMNDFYDMTLDKFKNCNVKIFSWSNQPI